MKHFHVKRLQRTLDTLHAQLKTWRQSSWMESPNWTRRNDYFGYDREDDADLVKVDTRTCGTAGCLAGWGAIIAGAKFVAHPGEFLELVAPPGRVRAVLSGEEDPRHVRAFAGEYFGLDDHQAHAQFDSENSYARLWALAMLFTGGRLTLPAEVTQDQAEGAREQGSEAYWAENFPREVLAEMEHLIYGEVFYAVDDQDQAVRAAALEAARQQADARELQTA